MNNPERIVFDSSVGRFDVESILLANDFSLEHEQDASKEESWAQVWYCGEENVTHVEDELFGFRYLATSRAQTMNMLRPIVLALPTISLGDAIKKLVDAKNVTEIVTGLGLVAGCAPPTFEVQVFAAVGSCFSHDNRAVRFAAVAAALYVNWSEFAPVLDELANRDTDSEVSEQARLASAYVKAGTVS